ncbi:MAG TPA: YfhO family protein, partial [Anaerolineae bacterium]|nr:YfhO family protein [Anaerolineae bacterium]
LWRVERLQQGMKDEGGGITPVAMRAVLWLALVIGLGILAGHAQTAVYGLIFVSFYLVWRIFSNRSSLRLSIPRSLILFVVAVLLGLALAAVQLLPAAELTRESQRAGGLDYTKIMTHSFWPLRLLTLLSPDFFGNPAQNNFWGYDNYWENAAYIGLIPLLLALYAIWNRLRRRPSPGPIGFLATTAILSLLLAFGWFTPIYPFLFNTVPGFDLFQGPARWLVVTILALCALAGFGMQHLIDHGVSRKATTRLILLGLALSLAGLVASVVLKGRVETFGPATLRLGALFILTGGLFRSDWRKPKWIAALVSVVALDLITAHFALNPTLSPEIYHTENPTAQAIAADGSIGRVFTFAQDEAQIKFGKYLAHEMPDGKQQFDGFGPNDLDYWLNERAALLPNAALIDRLPSANNFDSLLVGRYQNLLDQVEQLPLEQALPILSRMHIGYIVSPRELNLPIVTRTPDVTIYRNDQVLPRAWIAPASADLQSISEIVPESAVESLTDSGNAVTIRASSPQTGWLILADTFYPGWRATIDGVPVDIQMANDAFRAIEFPAGDHTIVFQYEPRSVLIGLLMSLASLATITVGLIVSYWRDARR